MNPASQQPSHLPAIAPDLVVRQQAGHWQLVEISSRLAAACNVAAEQLKGRLLEGIFPDSSPPLKPLLDEVADRGQDLIDVKLRLFPEGQPLLADLHFSGLATDYSGAIIRIGLRAESVASQLATGYAGLIGSSPAMREVFRKIELYAATDAAVVITGETGCGKELVAQALHERGRRAHGTFAAVNCSAISEQLLESELFGHEKGAFTGAVRNHRGHFEQADGGTLFLDEVGDMPLQIQSKLLRVLEDGWVQPVGSEQRRRVDVRVVAATNVPLEQAVNQGRFRADLYHRLAVLRIHIPPLRQRREDIPLLAAFFLDRFNQRYNKRIERLTPEALSVLSAYLWPGNVRELRNLLERLVIETEAPAIGGRALSEWVRERQSFQAGEPTTAAVSPPLFPSDLPAPRNAYIDAELVPTSQGDDINAATLRQAYRSAEGNIAAAARLLGIHRATFYRHLQRNGLTRDDLEV